MGGTTGQSDYLVVSCSLSQSIRSAMLVDLLTSRSGVGFRSLLMQACMSALAVKDGISMCHHFL